MKNIWLFLLLLLFISTSVFAVDPDYDISSGIVSFQRVTVNKASAFVNVELLLNPNGTWTILAATPDDSTDLELTGNITGSLTSDISDSFNSTFTGSLVQNGNKITGTTITNNPSLQAPLESDLSGEVNDGNISFSATADFGEDSTSEVFFEGTVSSDKKTLSGTYDWPAFDDNGTWTITLQ